MKTEFLTLLICITICTTNCTSKDDSDDKTDGGDTAEGATVNTSLKMPIELSLRLNAPKKEANLLTDLAAVGQTTSSSLSSLQYYIADINLCQEVEINGTGYSSSTGCIPLYSNSEGLDHDNFKISEAMADTEHYIDFMTAEGRAKFSQSKSYNSDHIGSYKWVIVSFAKPIKIKGSFITPGTTEASFITKKPVDSEIIETTVESRPIDIVRLSANPTSGEPELMTYMLNNGGTFFPLLKPLEITQEDVDAETPLYMDFVFNPSNFASAYQTTCNGTQYGTSIYNAVMYVEDPEATSTTCTYFDLPYAKMGAVPRKGGEGSNKEVYLIDMNEGEAYTRIELYYNRSDSEKSVAGADSAIVYNASPMSEAYSNSIQTYKITQEGSEVTFYGYSSESGQVDAANLTFTRGIDGTATFTCRNISSWCPAADGSTFTKPYTFEGVVEIGE